MLKKAFNANDHALKVASKSGENDDCKIRLDVISAALKYKIDGSAARHKEKIGKAALPATKAVKELTFP